MGFKRKSILWALAFLLLLVACGENAENADFGYDYAEEYETTESGAYYEDEYVEQDLTASDDIDQTDFEPVDEMEIERKLLKSAVVNFKEDSLFKRKARVDEAVNKYNAYISYEEHYTYYDRETMVTNVRVPAEHFDAFLADATQGVGAFDTKTISVDDVTEEFIDLEARIKTKKELKARYIELLSKAANVTEVLEIEWEIAALQAEIESFEGRLKYLSKGVRYSTLSITYYSMLPVPVEFDNEFELAFHNGWQGLIWFFVGLVSLWPFILIATIIILTIRFRLKRKNLKKLAK